MSPRILDLYCGQGGCAAGYERAGFEAVGVDFYPHPRYPHEFYQGDALVVLARLLDGGSIGPYTLDDFDAIHGSPVCKGYSVMNNLPWLRGREYPAHILPLRELLTVTGKPFIIENVMGARYGSKGLAKRGLEAHGMQAGWLCGTMFGLPLYRHRLFEANWPWLAPGHPPHRVRIRRGSLLDSNAPRSRGSWEAGYEERKSGRSRQAENYRPENARHIGRPQVINGSLNGWPENKGVGHTRGWRLAAAAMEVEWMDRDGTSQAIPPAFTEFIGRVLLAQHTDPPAWAGGSVSGEGQTALVYHGSNRGSSTAMAVEPDHQQGGGE